MGALTIIFFCCWMRYSYFLLPEKNTVIYVPNSNTNALFKALNRHGYETYFVDKLFFKLTQSPKKGWYNITTSSKNRFEFLKIFHTQQKFKMTTVKIYAGETSLELSKRLAKRLKLDSTKFLSRYHSKNQFGASDIFAIKYTFPILLNEKETIDYLIERSQRILDMFKTNYCYVPPTQKELRTLFTIASIIQKESNYVQEMPLISSVIYNRLEKDMKLQMDGILNYGKYSHIPITPERIRTDNSRYNTYKYKGLPPEPLCTIKIDALKAAYSPKKNNYLFFMLNIDGTHDFADTYKEHLENIRIYKRDKNLSISSND